MRDYFKAFDFLVLKLMLLFVFLRWDCVDVSGLSFFLNDFELVLLDGLFIGLE